MGCTPKGVFRSVATLHTQVFRAFPKHHNRSGRGEQRGHDGRSGTQRNNRGRIEAKSIGGMVAG